MDWIDQIQARHARTLTFPEIRKGVVALSRIYVEERRRIERGAVFDGAGKRAAFACYYSPLHFLLVQKLIPALGAEAVPARRIIDLGCGLAVAAAAWATLHAAKPHILGFERSSWAADEARWLISALGLRGRIHQKPLQEFPAAGTGDAIVAAYAVNELDVKERAKLLDRFLEAARRGAVVLVIEPLARKALPWWPEWQEAFVSASGRADEWRFAAELPQPLALFDRASGLDHRELTARSLCVGLPTERRKEQGPHREARPGPAE
ncbi:MAG TPA: class I SAM-dependent methyltransferase [Vicinamibacteria bacterium]|nr:class I SAM-dependent methyltransferase [Vicinamibacteria bacterium]